MIIYLLYHYEYESSDTEKAVKTKESAEKWLESKSREGYEVYLKHFDSLSFKDLLSNRRLFEDNFYITSTGNGAFKRKKPVTYEMHVERFGNGNYGYQEIELEE